jgi:hypothetical protein
VPGAGADRKVRILSGSLDFGAIGADRAHGAGRERAVIVGGIVSDLARDKLRAASDRQLLGPGRPSRDLSGRSTAHAFHRSAGICSVVEPGIVKHVTRAPTLR